MARKNRHRRSGRGSSDGAPAPIPMDTGGNVQPVMWTGAGLYGMGGNGWQGAEFSQKRGYVYFPELDTRRDLDSYSRTEILRRARFLMANVGFAQRIVNGLARMQVGTGMIPQATHADEEWNALAEAAFARRAESAPVWDVGGRYDFYASQLAKVRCRLCDGDVAEALTESETGRARFAIYEAHQVRNVSRNGVSQERWFDGVMCDRNNRAVMYRVVGDREQFVDFTAEDLIFFADYERPGRARGVSVLARAINNLVDTTEIVSWLKHGVKISSQMGYYIAAKDKDVPQGLSAALGGKKVRTEGTGTDKVEVLDVYGSGAIRDIGYREIKTLLDERPHPNTMGLLDYLARDIAWGADISPEVIWSIERLGGANSRFVLADAQGAIERGQELLVPVLKREWNYTIAKEIKSGNLREPRVMVRGRARPAPGSWLGAVAFIPPKRVTVDYGRDGKLMLDEIEQGKLTHERWFSMQGQDAREETLKELKFRAWRRDEARKLGFEKDPLDTAKAAAAGTAGEDGEDEEDTEDGKDGKQE